jgi:hypothetical protein
MLRIILGVRGNTTKRRNGRRDGANFVFVSSLFYFKPIFLSFNPFSPHFLMCSLKMLLCCRNSICYFVGFRAFTNNIMMRRTRLGQSQTGKRTSTNTTPNMNSKSTRANTNSKRTKTITNMNTKRTKGDVEHKQQDQGNCMNIKRTKTMANMNSKRTRVMKDTNSKRTKGDSQQEQQDDQK